MSQPPPSLTHHGKLTSVYGAETLDDVSAAGKKQAAELDSHVEFFQSNWEGAVVDRIQAARTDGTDGIVLNPGGWTHYSVAIRDALLGVDIPFIEVSRASILTGGGADVQLHVANIHSREEWRHHSVFHDKAVAVIVSICSRRG